MTALIAASRDALAKALFEAFPGIPEPGAKPWRQVWQEQADALLASGAVIDAAALADDEALVERAVQAWAGGAWPHRSVIARRGDITRARNWLRALAAALTERGETCSTCGGTGLVDWEPGAHRDSEEDQQPCPDCTERGDR